MNTMNTDSLLTYDTFFISSDCQDLRKIRRILIKSFKFVAKKKELHYLLYLCLEIEALSDCRSDAKRALRVTQNFFEIFEFLLASKWFL